VLLISKETCTSCPGLRGILDTTELPDAPRQPSNQDALDLVQANLVVAAVIELGRARRGMIGDHRGLLQRAAVLEVGRDAGGPEGVITVRCWDELRLSEIIEMLADGVVLTSPASAGLGRAVGGYNQGGISPHR
jgi:hypothetical protein